MDDFKFINGKYYSFTSRNGMMRDVTDGQSWSIKDPLCPAFLRNAFLKYHPLEAEPYVLD